MKLQKKRPRWRLKLLATAAVLVAMILVLDARLRPMIQAYGSNQAANRVTSIISQSVFQELAQNDVTYNRLVNLTYGENGKVTSLQTDMLELNRLQSSITQRIIDQVLDFDSQTITISLGALVGGPIFSGRGPNIQIKLIPSNFIQTKISNCFESAGINQTRHQVVMEVKMTVTAVMPGYRSSTAIDTSVVLAETIIVGEVPQAFTKVADGTDSLTGIIQDYQAQP